MSLNNIYGEIYAEFHKLIYYHCLKKLRNHQDAEDCMHEVFVKLFEKQVDVCHTTKFWLYKASDRIVMNYIRKQFRYQSAKELEETGTWYDPFEEKFNLGDYLEPKETALLKDYILQRKTDVELSKELCITPEAVRKRVSRLKAKVRNLHESED